MLDDVDILIAEDNPTNQMVAVQMLEALGARVTVASDGVEALQILEDRIFNLLLVDIEMPRLNGIELMKRIRAPESLHRATPIIALTAYVMREHRTAIAAAGADGVIPKPILSIDEFGRQILDFAGDRLRPVSSGEVAAEAMMPEGGKSVETSGVSASDAINRSTLDALGDAVGRDALHEIVEKAVEDIRTTGQRVCQGLDMRDLGEVRGALHILVGLAGAVGAERLERRVKDMQAALHAGDEEAFGARSNALTREVDAAVAGLTAF